MFLGQLPMFPYVMAEVGGNAGPAAATAAAGTTTEPWMRSQ